MLHLGLWLMYEEMFGELMIVTNEVMIVNDSLVCSNQRTY